MTDPQLTHLTTHLQTAPSNPVNDGEDISFPGSGRDQSLCGISRLHNSESSRRATPSTIQGWKSNCPLPQLASQRLHVCDPLYVPHPSNKKIQLPSLTIIEYSNVSFKNNYGTVKSIRVEADR